MKKRQNISALFTIAVFYLILESVFGITCPILFLTGISWDMALEEVDFPHILYYCR